MIKRNPVEQIVDALDQDPGYDIEPYENPFDDMDLTQDEIFKKYLYLKFPRKIADEFYAAYPEFEVDKIEIMKELVGKSQIFLGEPGTGKTFMACMLIILAKKNTWLYLNNQVIFYQMGKLLEDMRRFYVSDEVDPLLGRPVFQALIEDLGRVKYLILDDFGIEKSTDFTRTHLNQIIDDRYNLKNLVTIITTNYGIEEMINKSGNSRVMSRLIDLAGGKPIKLTKHYRKREINLREI